MVDRHSHDQGRHTLDAAGVDGGAAATPPKTADAEPKAATEVDRNDISQDIDPDNEVQVAKLLIIHTAICLCTFIVGLVGDAHLAMQSSLPQDLVPIGASTLLAVISTSCAIFIAIG
ncbi:hypothetical protein QQS21_009500 [Conoideocrella luteorostrata]|uniref:Uncharacterized protein n=1 Tax=Conoideocrella luteorostrata TaxID=1105319 RepID=A0AAJ0FQ92_9HYPO|nr:hypothetical protein QQS21_009500 [Conoideocrella luteorostrata]